MRVGCDKTSPRGLSAAARRLKPLPPGTRGRCRADLLAVHRQNRDGGEYGKDPQPPKVFSSCIPTEMPHAVLCELAWPPETTRSCRGSFSLGLMFSAALQEQSLKQQIQQTT